MPELDSHLVHVYVFYTDGGVDDGVIATTVTAEELSNAVYAVAFHFTDGRHVMPNWVHVRSVIFKDVALGERKQ